MPMAITCYFTIKSYTGRVSDQRQGVNSRLTWLCQDGFKELCPHYIIELQWINLARLMRSTISLARKRDKSDKYRWLKWLHCHTCIYYISLARMLTRYVNSQLFFYIYLDKLIIWKNFMYWISALPIVEISGSKWPMAGGLWRLLC